MIEINQLKGVEAKIYRKNGSLESCRFSEKNEIRIGSNVVIPRFSEPDYRCKYREALSFYEDGTIKSIYLEERQLVDTPLGKQEAELLTYYKSGNLHRFFPLYGQISAYWSEECEKELAPKMSIEVGEQNIIGKVSCICFYESGNVKSITLWPGENFTVKVGAHELTGRIGVSFYESGAVKSVEPVFYTYVEINGEKTHVYDPFANGISGDKNSLVFSEDGKIIDYVTIEKKKGSESNEETECIC